MAKSIFIVTGEASGDLLGAELIKAIQPLNCHISAVGGDAMRAEGIDIIFDANKLAVVGLWEVLKHFWDIKRAFKLIQSAIKAQKPDLLILIDYPGFNLRLAKFAHSLGIKVLFYVSPQIWAWRYHRIHFIKKYIDHMAVLFPFEEKIYQQAQIPVTFVGHPLARKITPQAAPKNIIGIFPGSRQSEISRLMPNIVAAVKQITLPNTEFLLPLAPGIKHDDIAPYLTDSSIKITEMATETLAPQCLAAITCSGTTTLELALYGIPQVIIYKLSPISFQLAKRLVRTPFIGLCNIVAETELAKELIQHDACPNNIATEITRLVKDDHYRQQRLSAIQALRPKLGDIDTATVLKSCIQELLNA